jgi:acetyltransferase-like isoleucine patch superfamily enzyme
MRAMGFAVGPGTSVLGMPRLTGADAPLQDNLRIGAECTIGPGCLIEVGEKLTLGDRVRLGTEVLIITTTHELGPKEHRAGPLTRRPVTIGEGAIIGARAILLPGVNVGAGAQVLAGSVVNKDVAPGTRAGGIPAKPLGPVEPAAA